MPAASRTASLFTAEAAEDCVPRWITLSASSSAFSPRHQLLALRVRQHRKGDAELRVAACDQPLHQRQRVVGAAFDAR